MPNLTREGSSRVFCWRHPGRRSCAWGPLGLPAIVSEHFETSMKAQEREQLLQILKSRFDKNMHRHQGIAWNKVRAKIEGNSDALKSLHEMQLTGGEPDVIGRDSDAGSYTFCDCSAESPAGR